MITPLNGTGNKLVYHLAHKYGLDIESYVNSLTGKRERTDSNEKERSDESNQSFFQTNLFYSSLGVQELTLHKLF